MLLGKKLKPTIESEWAVILDRSPNEFLRNKAVEKLAETFSISQEEARDLIENTPIILLDHLSFGLAERMKDHFTQANINCSLTKDTFTKRKCFRAVWPEQPNVRQLLGESVSDVAEEYDDALHTNLDMPLPAETKTSGMMSQTAFPGVGEEERRLRELTLDLQKENELLKLQLERAEDSIRTQEQQKYGGEVEKLESARLQEEETIRDLRNENRALSAQAEELGRQVKAFSEARLELETLRRMVNQTQESVVSKSEFTELRSQLEHVQTEYMKAQNAHRLAQGEAKHFQAEWVQTQKTLSEARAEIEEMKRMLSQAQENAVAKSQFTELRTQLDHFRAEYAKVQNAARLAQTEAKQYQAEWAEARKALSDARAESEDLKRLMSQVQKDSLQMREEAERICIEAESRLKNYTSELEEWKRKANDWSASYFKVVKENEFLRSHRNEEVESLKDRNQQLTGQLEQAQKQIRDFANQLEQQELIQKRMKATTQVAEQESRLKGLVQKQQTLESEIRLREEELKSILSEQEMVEQEIVKTKQAQKYVTEQTKLKEKAQSRLTRPRTTGQNPGFIAPPMEGS